MYDVVIIGAGVSGTASAGELSRYKMDAYVPEREGGVCCGTSKVSSAIVHAGYDVAEGSLMARLNVEGSQIMPELARELGFPFNPCGSSVICPDKGSLSDLRALYERRVKSGAKDLEIITDKTRMKEMESNLADEVTGVLYAPAADIVCPFNLNITLAESAYTNSTDFKLNTEMTDIRRTGGGWALETNQGVYETRRVTNAAGVHADKFRNIVNGTKIYITPRRRDYCLLGRSAGDHVSRTVFALSDRYGKDVLVSPTVHGNLIAGSTAIDIGNKEAMTTTREELGELIAKVGTNVKGLPMRQVVTSFTGLRAHENYHKFITKELGDAPGLVDCAGTESSDLIGYPAIGRMVAGILKEKLESEPDV